MFFTAALTRHDDRSNVQEVVGTDRRPGLRWAVSLHAECVQEARKTSLGLLGKYWFSTPSGGSSTSLVYGDPATGQKD
jgi:hypothetical protein